MGRTPGAVPVAGAGLSPNLLDPRRAWCQKGKPRSHTSKYPEEMGLWEPRESLAPDSSAPANFAEAINRAYNLVAATALGITALAFGSDLFVEADSIDKVDDSLLAVIGLAAVIWYFTSRHWAKRSQVPLLLTALALVVQIVGFGLELGDPAALGDDIPGLLVYVPLLTIVAMVYSLNGRYLSASPAAREVSPGGTDTSSR